MRSARCGPGNSSREPRVRPGNRRSSPRIRASNRGSRRNQGSPANQRSSRNRASGREELLRNPGEGGSPGSRAPWTRAAMSLGFCAETPPPRSLPRFATFPPHILSRLRQVLFGGWGLTGGCGLKLIMGELQHEASKVAFCSSTCAAGPVLKVPPETDSLGRPCHCSCSRLSRPRNCSEVCFSVSKFTSQNGD